LDSRIEEFGDLLLQRRELSEEEERIEAVSWRCSCCLRREDVNKAGATVIGRLVDPQQRVFIGPFTPTYICVYVYV
jgi:hypothetical protein